MKEGKAMIRIYYMKKRNVLEEKGEEVTGTQWNSNNLRSDLLEIPGSRERSV